VSVHAASCCGSDVTRCVSPDDITPTTLSVVPNRVGRNGRPRRRRLFAAVVVLSLLLLAATAGTLAGYVCPAGVRSPLAHTTSTRPTPGGPRASRAVVPEAPEVPASVAAPSRPVTLAVAPTRPRPTTTPEPSTTTSTTTTTRPLVDACVQVAGLQVAGCEGR
jgi:hypothetical protein